MKRILLVLFIFPVLAFLPTQKKGTASLGLLTKITSDTIKGQFSQINIGYDQLNRVVSITQTSYQMDAINKKGISNQMFTQEFTYQGNNKYPFSRKWTSYRYSDGNKKTQVSAYLMQYFKYANGDRIGDSLITTMVEKNSNGSLINQLPSTSTISNKNFSHESKYQVAPNEIIKKHRIDVLDSYKMLSSSFIFMDQLQLETNLTSAHFERIRYNNDYFGYHYKFLQYDQGVNPLQHLNIATYIGSELFDFQEYDFDTEVFPYDSEPTCLFNSFLGWSFMNKNNPSTFIKHGNSESSRSACLITKTNELSYTYNASKLPVSCKVTIKTLMQYDKNPTSYDEIANRRFYFEYR